MDLPLQAKLLRVLQEREVDRVGGKEPVSIDVRVLATTNRNLEETVREGKFRADLYYRLNVIPLTLPPLRERRSDIKLLTEHFMRQFLGERAPTLPAPVTEALMSHSWPGNVRELQNAVQRAAILSGGAVPRESDFLLSMNPATQLDTFRNDQSAPLPRLHEAVERTVEASGHSGDAALRIRSGVTVAEMEKTLILETLRTTDNNRTEAARLLDISIRTLRNKLHEYRAAGVVIEGD
jgi:DNA-binding NtrC family response regulator